MDAYKSRNYSFVDIGDSSDSVNEYMNCSDALTRDPMHRLTAVVSIIAATWALSACGLQSPDDGAARTSQDAPRLLVELQSLPYGHPPLPGDSLLPTLPEGHPPVPGYHSAPALPEGHPRCPARGSFATPPSDAGMDKAMQSPPELIST